MSPAEQVKAPALVTGGRGRSETLATDFTILFFFFFLHVEELDSFTDSRGRQMVDEETGLQCHKAFGFIASPRWWCHRASCLMSRGLVH